MKDRKCRAAILLFLPKTDGGRETLIPATVVHEPSYYYYPPILFDADPLEEFGAWSSVVKPSRIAFEDRLWLARVGFLNFKEGPLDLLKVGDTFSLAENGRDPVARGIFIEGDANLEAMQRLFALI